ncbi:MAG: DUF2845 domain-containing protein [Muribaculaceae bacterium]|nr:DUF2845 domain-containing protein [Muribaculaceae bacterium]
MRTILNYIIYTLILPACCVASACSTGIEGTKTITMSRADKKATRLTPEEEFLNALSAAPLAGWNRGKRFYVADNKAAYVLESIDKLPVDSLKGHILNYEYSEPYPTAGGTMATAIVFSDGARKYRYASGKNESAARKITGLEVPMLIDLDFVAAADSMLSGKTLWTRTQLWYTPDGNPLPGKKFVPVKVKEVTEGNMVFPLRVVFEDADGRTAFQFMGVSAGEGLRGETRTFPSLYYLGDPREKYTAIAPDVWQLIQEGKVRAGMTKAECKLSLGNPNEVDAGHNWSNTIDVWTYSDGTFLYFEDGLLVKYRH